MKKLTALFAFAFFLLFVGRAITPVQADPPRPTHNHGGSGITYTAELTSTSGQDGAFEFGPVNVTPNEKENQLRFETAFQVTPHNNKKNAGAWAQVFNDCVVLGPTNLPEDQIPNDFEGDGYIDKPGGVGIFLTGIQIFKDNKLFVEGNLLLIGNCFHTDGCTDNFVPTSGNPFTVTLTHFWLTGHTVAKGKRGHCNQERRTPELNTHSTLTITAQE